MNNSRYELRAVLAIIALATSIGCAPAAAPAAAAPPAASAPVATATPSPGSAPAVPPTAAPSSPVAQDDGEVFEPEGGEFTVTLPGTPTSQELPTKKPGEKGTVYTVLTPTKMVVILVTTREGDLQQTTKNFMAGVVDAARKAEPDMT